MTVSVSVPTAPSLATPAQVDPAGVVAFAAALVTQLADAWFLICLLSLSYWLAPRVTAEPRAVAATLLGLGFAALAASLGAKSVFTVPRPPGATAATPPAFLVSPLRELFRSVATSDGFGLPSGHATAAAAMYGGFAVFLDVGTRRGRWLAAGSVVVLVAGTRVVLGLHTVWQVVVGAVFGGVLLWAATRAARPGSRLRPDRLFTGVTVVGLVALVVTTSRGHGEAAAVTAVAVGGGLAGALVWRLHGRDDTPVGGVGAVVGLAFTAVPFGFAGVVANNGLPAAFPDTLGVRVAAVTLGAAVAIAFVLLWPTLVGRLRRLSSRE